MDRLGSGPGGLGEAEAARRLREHGPNRLKARPGRTMLARLGAQFANVLVGVLIASAIVTALIGEILDSAVITGVILVNAVIGFIQEAKAEKAIDAIRAMLALRATVLRDGCRRPVPAEDLVPGDLVLLASGDKVPADLRLVEARSLEIQEAALTGESMPVPKNIAAVAPAALPADRTCMAFTGTLVSRGQGLGVVVGTGETTEIGRVNALVATAEPLTTPLLAAMTRFSRRLSGMILVLAGTAFALGLWLREESWTELFMAAVGIAVAAIPEGLPAVMTITLAIGVDRMARRKAIIRRLPAVETLGAVTVICSDKTGTLTRNELTVRHVATAEGVYRIGGDGYRPDGSFTRDGAAPDPQAVSQINPGADPMLAEICRAAVLCNDGRLIDRGDGWTVDGDPTDGALLALGLKAGFDPAALAKILRRCDTIPFDADLRFMAVLHRSPDGTGLICVKGAPERVLAMSDTQPGPAGLRPLDAAAWQRQIHDWAGGGLRVLALASAAAPAGKQDLTPEDVGRGLTFLGLLALADAPREEAVAAVAACRRAGIRVQMITGDHADTAQAVGAAFGLGRGHPAVTGLDLDRLDDRALEKLVGVADIFARTTPEHKLRLVKAHQRTGNVVAMTGDGVNDAPALRQADIGIAMGAKGTEAAKEVADMVLADDNFASIACAVEEGRTVYDNLRKAILFMLPTNGAEALVILIALLSAEVLPITPVQILWVNMISAVTLGIALAFEPPEADVMRRPPRRPDAALLSPLMVWRIVWVMALLVALSFGLFRWAALRGAGIAEARTAAVNALVIGQIFYLWNARALTAPVANLRGLFGSAPVLIAIAAALLFQMGFTYLPPLQALFGTAALPAATWAAATAAGGLLFLAIEIEKAVLRRIKGR